MDGSGKDFIGRGGGGGGGGVDIIQFHSISVGIGSIYALFLFQSLNVRASENLSASSVFQLDLL